MDYSLPIATRTRKRHKEYEDYSLPIATRTRQRREGKNGVVDSASASRPSRGSSKKLPKKVNCVTMKTESEYVALSDTVEEIDVNLLRKEGDDLVGFVGEEDLGLNNKGEGEDVDESSGCLPFDDRMGSGVASRTRSRVGLSKRNEDGRGTDAVSDDSDGRGTDAVSDNEDGRGTDAVSDNEDGRGTDAVSDNEDGRGTDALDGLEASSSEDNGEDEDDEVVKIEHLSMNSGCEKGGNVDKIEVVKRVRCIGTWPKGVGIRKHGEDEDDEVVQMEKLSEKGEEVDEIKFIKIVNCVRTWPKGVGTRKHDEEQMEQLSMDSGYEKGEDVDEMKVINMVNCIRTWPKGVGVGVKRKHGLDFFVDSEDESDNQKDNSINAVQDLNFVAQRTRSHYPQKKVMFGTLSHPPCVDEEEVDSSSVHDDSEDGGDEEDNQHMQKVHGKDEDNECMQKVHGKDEGDLRQPSKRKCTRLSKNSDVIKILLDSTLDKGDVPLQELVSSRDEAPKDESNAEMSLPLKFTFGIEESNPPEKSEDEKEMDKLWVDLNFALRSSEIGSVNSSEVENEDALPAEDESDRATLCHQGNHQLILDEQIGLRCTFCSYVKLEIKYILPSFSNMHPRRKKSDRGASSAVNQSIFDELRFQESGCQSNSGCDPLVHAEGTVWDIIPGIKSSMYPHQREGFEFIWKNIAGGIYLDKLKNQKPSSVGGSGCIISHAPGTGKSRLAIVFLQTYMELYPTCRPVIVAPYSMLLTWEEEFRKWNFDIPFHNMNKNELSGKENITAVNLGRQDGQLKQNVDSIRVVKLYSWKKDRSILGISYTLFEKLTGQVEKKDKGKIGIYAQYRKILLDLPGLVVLDEGHTPRNSESHIWKAVSNIKTGRRIILSGTPFQNNFDELYNTLCLARPKFADKETRGKWASLTSSIRVAEDDRLKHEKVKRVRDMIKPFVHVYKGSILEEKLPGLRDSVIILKPGELQKSLIQRIQVPTCHLSHLKLDYYESLISVHPSLLLKFGEEEFCTTDRDKLERLRLNPECGVKTKFLKEFIPLCEAMKEKVVVFGQFIEPLNFIAEQLKSHFNWSEGKELLYMDGKQDVKRRQCSINVFNDPRSEAKVLLASIKACNEGINLVGASRVVLLDVVWNPSVERQAISRAYRLGQEKAVYVYHLIASGTKEAKYHQQVNKDLLSELVFSSSGNQQKISPTDQILQEMVQHKKLEDMFEKIFTPTKESYYNISD